VLADIESTLIVNCGLDRARLILVGVSGGPDSMCLLHLLHRGGWQVVVAHFNHRLRPEADEEARDVEVVAAGLSLPFVSESVDVRAHAVAAGLSIEEAARNLRYEFLVAQARKCGAQAVAVGHTADDQVETVLMHFIRGAGLNGLKGMRHRIVLPVFDPAIPIVRPLLDCWRRDTIAYCEAHGLPPHFDPSNASLDFLRNRLRHELIPQIETYNPGFRQALWRTAQSLSADYALLNEMLESEWERAIHRESGDCVAFDLGYLSQRPHAVQRSLVRRAAERLVPTWEATFLALEHAATFIADRAGTRVDLGGGLMLIHEGELLYVCRDVASLPFEAWPQMPLQVDSIQISLAGSEMLQNRWRFESGPGLGADLAILASTRNQDRFQISLDAETLPEHLELRVRRRGDRFEPLGMQGHSLKLSDYLVNEKMPRRARGRWPLLCAGDTVIWVPGYRPAECFKMREHTRRVVRFSLVRDSETL
jgi:tRNA(Ile)-lysidine synthase